MLTALLPVSSVFAVPASISSHQIEFKKLSKKDGLSQIFVFDLTQDQDGFIWIATQEGLNRFDGKNFKHYRHNPNNINSIADNFTRNMYIDRHGILWVGTANGLSRYVKEFDHFVNYRNIQNESTSLTDNRIWDISEDNSGTLIVTTEQGFHKYVRENDNFARKKIKNLNSNLFAIKTAFQDANNNYWLGGYDTGIFIVNESLTRAVSLAEANSLNLNLGAKSLYQIKPIGNDYWLATDNGAYVISNDYVIKKHYLFSELENDASNIVRNIEQSPTSLGAVAPSNKISRASTAHDKGKEKATLKKVEEFFDGTFKTDAKSCKSHLQDCWWQKAVQQNAIIRKNRGYKRKPEKKTTRRVGRLITNTQKRLTKHNARAHLQRQAEGLVENALKHKVMKLNDNDLKKLHSTSHAPTNLCNPHTTTRTHMLHHSAQCFRSRRCSA